MGYTGLIISQEPGAVYPSIVQIYPGSPAATDGRLKPGDEILAVSEHGMDGPFVSLKGMTPRQSAPLFQGSPGSLMWVKARNKRPGRELVETVVPLLRLEFGESERIDFAMKHYPADNYTSTIQPMIFNRIARDGMLLPLPYDRSPRIPILLGAEWTHITNGASAASVIRERGEPPVRLVEIGFNEETWTYPHSRSLPGETNKNRVYLRLTNGVVKEIDLFQLP